MARSTRKIHVFGGVVDVVVDHGSTAGEIIERVQAVLPPGPGHGNTLLSCGWEKFQHADAVPDVGDLTLADYSLLAQPRRLQIPTERSGVTISQIQALLDFVYNMIGWLSEHGSWAGSFGKERGKPLSYNLFNLYHADEWIIRPATAAPGTSHGRHGCSYVELVAEKADDQLPLWFVSHAWLEPIILFLACLRRHASIRELSGQALAPPAYWVCAYANNQHVLEDAISENPRKTSFYKAMQLCYGVLLVLDSNATPFSRIWCCFEESIAVEERDSNNFLLDVAATDTSCAHVITDGLAGAEGRTWPILGLLCKSQREQAFPVDVLEKGLGVDIATAQASKEEDKTRILNSIAFPRAKTLALNMEIPTRHPNYDIVNKALASHFALAAIDSSYRQGYDPSRLLQALKADDERTKVQLSLTGCQLFNERHLYNLLNHMPGGLQSLRLDLAYTGLECVDLDGISLPSLKTLVLRFTGSLRSVSGLLALTGPSLRHLELWFSNLPDLEDIQFGDKALWKLQLQQLVFYVHGCPLVPQASKKALHLATQKVKRFRHGCHIWVHIEDTASWLQTLKSLAWGLAGRGLAKQEASSSPPHFETGVSGDFGGPADVFPCNCCKNFHSNLHGYCNAHRFSRFHHKFFSSCHLAFQWSELVAIFLVQAAADIESRALLALIVISLYPMLCIGLAEIIEMSATLIGLTSLSLLFASVSFAALRFDQMQRAALELALASEAICLQVLQPANLSHPSLVFGTCADVYPSIKDVRQEHVMDLRNHFFRARMHFKRFEHALRRAVDGLVVKATIKRLADLDNGGADTYLDILSCEISCESLQQVQSVWVSLSNRFQSEEEPLRIAALWDGFAQEEERRCSKIVLSIDGYLATVVLLVTPLAKLEKDLSGLCRLADSFGLLDEAKPRRWLQNVDAADGAKSLHAVLRLAMALVRLMALLIAVYFTCQYIFRYGPSHVQASLPVHFRNFLALSNADSIMEAPSWWRAMCLAAPYAVLVIVFSHDLVWIRPRSSKLKLSQILYERHFGIQGRQYDLKVAALQALTVLLQALGKLHLLGGITVFAIQQNSSATWALKAIFWTFWLLLLFNSIYPSVLLMFPKMYWFRCGSALLDVSLDLGYLLTYLLLVVIGMTDLHVETSVSGNFGTSTNINFRNSISPVFAFPSSLLQYLAVYMSLAHICCACRSLERTAQGQKEEPRHQSHGAWRDLVGVSHMRCCLKYLYSPSLVAVLIALLLSQDVYPGHRGDFACFPCRCDGGLLQSCGLAGKLQQQQLVIAKLRGIHPEAFQPLGCHLSHLSLANSSLVQLNSTSFKHLPCLRVLDLGRAKLRSLHEDTFFGLAKLEVLSLSENELTQISATHLRHLPSLEKLVLGSMEDVDKQGHRFDSNGGNLIEELPPRFLEGNQNLKVLDLSGNRIQRLHQETFLDATQLEGLDLNTNKIRALPEGIFAGLSKLRTLWLHNNSLSALPEGIFAGLSELRELRLYDNSLSALPEGIFANLLELRDLSMYNNRLNALPEGIFAGLSELRELRLFNNRLSALPAGIFADLSELRKLYMYSNRLSALPAVIFAGLSKLQELWLFNNSLSALPEGIFADLSELRDVSMYNNKLSALPAGIFAGLSELQTLWLHDNRLSALPEGIFADLSELRDLPMYNNRLSALPAGIFQGLSELRDLSLRDNRLSALPEGIFADLSELRQLYMYNNRLKALPEGIFAGPSELQKLWLHDNRLSALPEGIFAGLSELRDLSMYNNQLSVLPAGIFAGLSKLQELWVFENRLSALPEGIFAGLSELRELGLYANSLSALPEGIFAGLPELRKLYMHDNRLSALPAGIFAALSELRSLYLNNNSLSTLPVGVFSGLSKLQQLRLEGNILKSTVLHCVEKHLSCQVCQCR